MSATMWFDASSSSSLAPLDPATFEEGLPPSPHFGPSPFFTLPSGEGSLDFSFVPFNHEGEEEAAPLATATATATSSVFKELKQKPKPGPVKRSRITHTAPVAQPAASSRKCYLADDDDDDDNTPLVRTTTKGTF